MGGCKWHTAESSAFDAWHGDGDMGYLQRLPLPSYLMLHSLRLGLDGNTYIHTCFDLSMLIPAYLHVVYYANAVCNIVILRAGSLYEHLYETFTSLYKNQPPRVSNHSLSTQSTNFSSPLLTIRTGTYWPSCRFSVSLDVACPTVHRLLS